MGLYGRYTAINELKKVPTEDPGEEGYDIPPEAEEPEDEPADNYDLPDDEVAASEEPTDNEEPAGNYDLEEEEDPAATEEEPTDELPEEDNTADDYGLDTTDTEDPATEEEPTDDTEMVNDTEETSEEDQLFSGMTTQQKAIRDKELASLFIELYNSLSDLVITIDRIDKNGQNLNQLDFVTRKTNELRTLIYDYIIFTYKTKSYLENHTQYYRFIAISNQINKILTDIKRKEE